MCVTLQPIEKALLPNHGVLCPHTCYIWSFETQPHRLRRELKRVRLRGAIQGPLKALERTSQQVQQQGAKHSEGQRDKQEKDGDDGDEPKLEDVERGELPHVQHVLLHAQL